MTRWHEEEWGAKQLAKLQKAVADNKYRKIVRIVDKIMDEYDLEEHEIWEVAGYVLEEEEDEVHYDED